MQIKDKKITDLTSLITSLHKNPTQTIIDDLLRHSSRILNSFIGNAIVEDIQSYKSKIVDRVLVISHNDNKKAIKAQELLQKILKSKTLQRKPQIFKLLLKISENSSNVNQSFDVFKSRTTVSSFNPLNSTKNNLNTTQETAFNGSAYTSLRKPVISQQLAIIRHRGSVEHNISQTDIVRETLFVMQNITGNLISYDKDFFVLKPGLAISDPVRKICRQLCQIGWLYKKLNIRVQQEGTVRSAFDIAIRQEKGGFYKFVALMETMAKNDQITLRKLMYYSLQPFERIKWLAIISQAINPYNGCKIISIINSYRPQGNPVIMDLLNRILNHIIQPLLKFIYLWVYKGELHDPMQEFFIFDDVNINLSKLWQDKYKIIEQLIPNLIDQQSALMIFNTGKTINFLKKCCNHDYQIDVEFIDHRAILSEKHSESTNLFGNIFKDWLSQVSQKANKQLISVLFQKFKLKMHLDALKRFLLMGQGQFIHNLMDSLSSQLAESASTIHKHHLIGILEGALRSSNTQYLNKQILDRVTIKLFDLTGAYDGWDIFSLDYIIDSPLNTLLTPQIMKHYLKIFNFLWKVKRVDHFLNQVWLNHAKQVSKKTSHLKIFHYCHLLRNAMMHFITNIYGYIMVAIEATWKGFIDNIDNATNFQEVIKMHENMINQLLDICFLTQKNKQIYVSLFNVFGLIFKFKNSQDKLLEEYGEYAERLREIENRKKIKYMANFEQMEKPVFKTDSMHKMKEINDLYQKAYKNFSNLIKKQEQKLTFLNFRLDFNEYYAYSFLKKNYSQ